VDTDSPLADVLVRVGDVDNFGFDWPADFTPFAGRSTPTHGYPWEPGADDAEGTDRIMVGSGYRGEPPYGQDGYTSTTGRPANAVRPIELSYALHGVTMRSAVLQLFVDDFQAPVFRTSYEVRLDGERIPLLETVVNTLEQTGPIGKLVSVEILPEHFHLLEDGNVAILFDDPATGAGDGFAIDFVQLLINPKELPFVGSIRGSVVEKESGAPLEGALVSSAVVDDETTPEGQYALSRVPAGLVVVQASKAGYESESVLVDLEADSTLEVDLALARRNEESDTIRRELDETGRAQLRGIYFDLDSATLKSESEATLFAVLAIIQDNPDTVYTIEGHTDAEGAQEYNVELSRQRAQAVVQWLLGRGVTAEQLDVQGYGESRPVADNGTAAGRALNRRVEIVQGQ
jgi:outer membrane protein OmpA-like peptidoglycan-associated protein